MIRLLLVLFPLMFMIGGSWVSWQATSFWLQITGEPKILSTNLNDLPDGVNAKIFLPERITPDAQTQIEIESQIADTSSIANLVWSFEDDCDFIWLDPPRYTVDIKQNTEPARFIINTRNTSPPSYCSLFLYLQVNQKEKKLVTTIRLPINTWVGKSLSTIKILFGFLATLAGLRSTITVLFDG